MKQTTLFLAFLGSAHALKAPRVTGQLGRRAALSGLASLPLFGARPSIAYDMPDTGASPNFLPEWMRIQCNADDPDVEQCLAKKAALKAEASKPKDEADRDAEILKQATSCRSFCDRPDMRLSCARDDLECLAKKKELSGRKDPSQSGVIAGAVAFVALAVGGYTSAKAKNPSTGVVLTPQEAADRYKARGKFGNSRAAREQIVGEKVPFSFEAAEALRLGAEVGKEKDFIKGTEETSE